MIEMEKTWVNISDVLFFQEGPGVRNTQYTTSGVKLLNVANLVDGKVDLSTSDRYISEDEAYGKYSHFLCDVGDFIVASSGIKVEYIDKKMGFIEESMLPLCMNTSTIRFKVLDEKQLRIRYFMYYLKSQHFKGQLAREITGSAQLNYGPSHLKKMVMPLVDISIQDEIVQQMDKVQKIIDMRQMELSHLDDLIKARFVEMFGEPQINPFHWDVVNISEVVGGKVSNGFFAKRDDYCDDGNVSILGVANIVNRMYSKVNELPKTNANNKDIEKFEVKYGDMLFCRSSLVAEGIGKASIVPEDVHENVLFECHVIRLPLNLNKCVPEFMQTLSTMDFFRNQVVAQSKTATMTTIGQDGILKTDIILPPIEKQKEFYDFVKQVDKSKVVVQKSLDETQQLFDSLMQKYFG